MDFPAATGRFAGGALQPAFGAAIDVTRQKIPAGASVRIIGMGQRRHRTAGAGLRDFPRAGWNPCRPWSARRRRHCGRRQGRSRSAPVRHRRAGRSSPSRSLSSILAKASSGRDMLQPPVPSAIRISVNTALAGPIADRPARPHALYRASLYRGGGAYWTAGGRNSELQNERHDLHQTPPDVNIR